MQPWKQIGRFGTVGIELVLSMGVGYFLGRWADGKLGTKFLAILGLVVGVYAGFRNLVRASAIMQKEAEREAEAELRKGPKLLETFAEKDEAAAAADEARERGEAGERGARDGDPPS